MVRPPPPPAGTAPASAATPPGLPHRPIEACLRAERRIAVSSVATLQWILSDKAAPHAVRRYRKAHTALLPVRDGAPLTEEAMAALCGEGTKTARAIASAIAKTLPESATAATAKEFLGTILQIDIDPPNGSPATLARTSDLHGLLPVLADALAQQLVLLPLLEAAAALEPPTRLPLLAPSRGVAAWISADGEIRITRRTDALPQPTLALPPFALTLDGEQSAMSGEFRRI